MRGLLVGCAVIVALLFTLAPASAADGIKATAVASREVPADTLVVSFHMIERSLPEQDGRLRAEEQRIRREIEKAGATVASWTSRIAIINAGLNTSASNYISPSSTDRQAIDTRRDIRARLTGVTDEEHIAAILGRNGVRHGVTLTWTSSVADKAREDLEFEAAVAAVTKARALAERIGAKAGGVIDLHVQRASTNNTAALRGNTTVIYDSVLTFDTLNPTPDELVEDKGTRALLIRVSATVTLQPLSN